MLWYALYAAVSVITGAIIACYQWRENGRNWFQGWVDYVLCSAVGLMWPLLALGVLPWLCIQVYKRNTLRGW